MSIAARRKPCDGAIPLESRSGGGSETILLVEDDETVRKLTKELLQAGGYQVLEAANGATALAIAAQVAQHIDLLLTDVVMPEMSGREVANRLISVRPGIRVLYMSGYTDDAIGHHGLLDSDISLLEKPFTPQALAVKIRAVLETKGFP